MLEYENIINESLTSNPQDYLKGPFSILLDSNKYTYGSDSYLTTHLLSEEEIEKNYNRFDKNSLVKWQILSENFIVKHLKDLNLLLLTRYQVLSEDFIKRVCMPIYLDAYTRDFFKSLIGNILMYQSVSDEFILDYYNTFISFKSIANLFKYQEMNKETVKWILNINKNKKSYALVCGLVCHYFELDEEIMREYPEFVNNDRNRYFVQTYQVLPEEYREENNLRVLNASLITKEFWERLIRENGKFECAVDGFYVYKLVRADGYCVFNSRYKYELNNTYHTFSDYSYNTYSFGFDGSTFKGMKYYKITIFKNSPKFKIIKLKVKYEDITFIGDFSFRYDDSMVRFNTFEVVEFEETEGDLTKKLINDIKNRDYNIVYNVDAELKVPNIDIDRNKFAYHEELRLQDVNVDMFDLSR